MVCMFPLPSTQQSALSLLACFLLLTCPLLWVRLRAEFKRISLTYADYMSCVWPLLSVSYFLWPIGLQLGTFYSVLCPWPPQTLQAGISCDSKEQNHFFLSRDIRRNSWDCCLGRYARPGECFPCHYTKSQRLWSKASAVLYLSVAWEMLAMRSKYSLLHVMWVPVPERYKVLSTTFKRAVWLISSLSVWCIFLSSHASMCLVDRTS